MENFEIQFTMKYNSTHPPLPKKKVLQQIWFDERLTLHYCTSNTTSIVSVKENRYFCFAFRFVNLIRLWLLQIQFCFFLILWKRKKNDKITFFQSSENETHTKSRMKWLLETESILRIYCRVNLIFFFWNSMGSEFRN